MSTETWVQVGWFWEDLYPDVLYVGKRRRWTVAECNGRWLVRMWQRVR